MPISKFLCSALLSFFCLFSACHSSVKTNSSHRNFHGKTIKTERIIDQIVEQLEQDPEIKVYFNHNQAKKAKYLEPYRQIWRQGDNLEQIIIEQIRLARNSIDLAIYHLNSPLIAKALVEQAKLGIKVRVILDNSYNESWSKINLGEIKNLPPKKQENYQEFKLLADLNQDGKLSNSEIINSDAIAILQQANIPLIDDTSNNSAGSSLMHHKFMIVDKKAIVTGSANWTLSGLHGDISQPESRGNANHLLVLKSQELANLFTEEFNLMWLDNKFAKQKPLRKAKSIKIGNSIVTVKFSPNSPQTSWQNTSNGLIAKVLSQSKKSIDLALFVFSTQKLADTLQQKQTESVKIRGVFEPEFAFRPYSEVLDMLGLQLSRNCRFEKNNNPWLIPLKTIGYGYLNPGDKLHHKSAIVDQQIVITGSHNWSAAANYSNDETLLIIDNKLVAQHFMQEFTRLYQQAEFLIPNYLQSKLASAKQCQLEQPALLRNNDQQIVNINSANLEQLKNLPGIGETIGKNIIIARQKKPFTSWQDLRDRVSGIGDSKIEKIKDKVIFY